MMREEHYVKRTFVLQHDSSDCGVACLRSALRYYGGDEALERIRELSGTSVQGTTLLGLYEAANQMGFDAEGCEAEIADLVDHNEPTILHVLTREGLEHYILWYGCFLESNSGGSGNGAIRWHRIGDPAMGVTTISEVALEEIWRSKKCLTLSPNDRFVRDEMRNKEKVRWFLKLLRDDWGLLATASVLGLLMAVLGMVMALFSQKLIDEILPAKNYPKLWSGLGLVLFLLLIRTGMEFLRSYILVRQSADFNKRIVGGFYDQLLQLPKMFFDNRKTGDLITRINDTTR